MIVGVSPDSVKRHQNFKQKYSLPFTLVADASHAVATAYGVWQQKSMFGKKYMGIARSTFVIDPSGRIAAVFPKVSVEGHAEAVRRVIEAGGKSVKG